MAYKRVLGVGIALVLCAVIVGVAFANPVSRSGASVGVFRSQTGQEIRIDGNGGVLIRNGTGVGVFSGSSSGPGSLTLIGVSGEAQGWVFHFEVLDGGNTLRDQDRILWRWNRRGFLW